MRRPRRSWGFVLAAAASLVACRQVLGLTPPQGSDAGSRDAEDDAEDVESGEVGPVPYWTFTDGFEEGNLGKWQQTIDPGTSGSLTVVDAGAYEGCCAMQAIVDQGASRTSPYEYVLQSWADASTPLVDAGTIAVRAHVKVASLDDNVGLISIVQGGTSPVAYSDAVFAPNSAGESWGIELLDPANTSVNGASGSNLPDGGADDQWHCIELDMNVGATGQMSLFVDPNGVTETPSVHFASSTIAAGGWDSVQLGLPFSSPGSATSEITYDDVEIALFHDDLPTIHIGCP